MTFEVEIDGLTCHQESLLLDRILETIKFFGVEENEFRIFLDDGEESDTDNEYSKEQGRGDTSLIS